MEVLTTLLVILTIIQPFTCLHPVIIWSQDSAHNSSFLMLIILIWFLPLIIHIFMKAVLNQSLQRCSPDEKSGIEETSAFQRSSNIINVAGATQKQVKVLQRITLIRKTIGLFASLHTRITLFMRIWHNVNLLSFTFILWYKFYLI